MALHKSHGKPYPTTARADELPTGEPAPEAKESDPVPRGRGGRILTSEAARELGRRGGKKSGEARSEKNPKRWGARLGLGTLLDDPRLGEEALFRPFQEDAEKWFRAKCEELASTVGGGVCSAGVTSIIRTAAWERAFSAYLFELAMTKAFGWDRGTDKAGKATLDPRLDLASLASKLGDSSRQNLLAAHELCAREAMARKNAPASTSNALAERVEVLIAAEQANAQRWKSQLEAKSASVEAPSATDSQGVVADPPSTPPEPMRSGPTRSDPTVAPSAPTAAPHPTSAPSMPPTTPSAPRGAVVPSTPRYVSPEEGFERDLRQRCQTWIANSGRRTIEEAQACVDAQRAAMSAIRSRYHRGQEAERNWRAKQSRGPMPVPSVRIPWPASRWFRQDRDGAEADYAVRIFKWILDDEPKEQKR